MFWYVLELNILKKCFCMTWSYFSHSNFLCMQDNVVWFQEFIRTSDCHCHHIGWIGRHLKGTCFLSCAYNITTCSCKIIAVKYLVHMRFKKKISSETGDKMRCPQSGSSRRQAVFFMSWPVGVSCWWPLPSSVKLVFSLCCISIQMKTSCQSK